MLIQLNPAKQSLWFFQGAGYDFRLTDLEPGPVEIDYTRLDSQQQAHIVESIMYGHITRVDSPDLPVVDSTPMVQSIVAPQNALKALEGYESPVIDETPKELPVPTFRPPVQDLAPQKLVERTQSRQKELVEDAKALLRKHIKKMSAVLESATFDHLPLINMALQLEMEKRRSRKPVKELLKAVQEKLMNQVSANIEQTEHRAPHLSPHMRGAGLPEVTWEEEEEIKVTLVPPGTQVKEL